MNRKLLRAVVSETMGRNSRTLGRTSNSVTCPAITPQAPSRPHHQQQNRISKELNQTNRQKRRMAHSLQQRAYLEHICIGHPRKDRTQRIKTPSPATPTSMNVSTRAPTPSLPRRYPSSRSLYHFLQPWGMFEPDAQSIPESMGVHAWRQAPRPACPTRAGRHW